MALVVLATGLALFRIDAKSLWLDEAFSASVAGQDLRGVLSWSVVGEPNHGLYHLLLHFVTGLGGDSGWILRGFSAALVVGTVPMLFLLARRLFGRQVAIASSLLFSVNAFVVAYAQEARPYALALFLTTCCSLAFVRAVSEPSGSRWIAYVVLAVLAVHAHLFAAFVLIAHGCSLVFLHPDRRVRRGAIASFSAVAVLCVPLLWFTLESGTQRIAWISEPTIGGLMELLADLVGRGGVPLALAYLCLFGLAVKPIRGAWRGSTTSSTRWAYVFVLLWAFLPIALALAISFVRPILVPRYLIGCVPALAMLAGVGLVHIRRPGVRIGTACLVVLLGGLALRTWYSSEKEDWREATSFVLSSAREGDGIVLHPRYLVWPFGHYVLQAEPDRVPEPVSPPVRWVPGLPWSGPEEPLASFFGSDARPARVWLILRPEREDHLLIPERRWLLDLLRETYSTEQEVGFEGIRVLLFA